MRKLYAKRADLSSIKKSGSRLLFLNYRRLGVISIGLLCMASFTPKVNAYTGYNEKTLGWPKFIGFSSGTEVTTIVQNPSELCEYETDSEGVQAEYRNFNPTTGERGHFCVAENGYFGWAEAKVFKPVCMVADRFPYNHVGKLPQWDGTHHWYRTEKLSPDEYGLGPWTCPAPETMFFPIRDMSTGWVREADQSESNPPPAPPALPNPADPPPDASDPPSDSSDPAPGPNPNPRGPKQKYPSQEDLGDLLRPGMCVGDPIIPATGEVFENISDYDENGVDPLSFKRIYRSRWSSGSVVGVYASPMGKQWAHNYSTTLRASDFNVSIRMWDGSVRSFIKNRTSGNWLTWGRFNDSLTQSQIGWQYRRADDGITLSFDVSGKLLSVTELNGWVTTYSYTNQLLSSVTNNFGRSLTFSYNNQRLLSEVSNTSGSVVEFQYDNLDRLTVARYSDGLKQTYSYEGPHPDALTAINDEEGLRYVDFEYDSLGRGISSQNFNGNGRFSVSYGTDDASTSAIVTDPLGTERTYTYHMGQKLGVSSASKPAAGSNDSTASTTFSNESDNFSEVDFLGRRVIKYNNQSGHLLSKIIAHNTSEQRFFYNHWIQDVPLIKTKHEPGRRITNIYNGQPDPFDSGNIARCSFSSIPLPDGSSAGVICKQIVQATLDRTGAQGDSAQIDSSIPARIWTWNYDQDGQLINSRDPRGHSSSRSYYSTNTDTHKKGDLKDATNALGHVTSYIAYDARGNVLTYVDANGVSISYTYDLRNRVRTTTIAGETTQISYKPMGSINKVVFPDGSFIQYKYDAAHRLISIADALGNTINYTLDKMGNRIQTSVKDPSEKLIRLLDRSIDPLGRVRLTTGAGE